MSCPPLCLSPTLHLQSPQSPQSVLKEFTSFPDKREDTRRLGALPFRSSQLSMEDPKLPPQAHSGTWAPHVEADAVGDGRWLVLRSSVVLLEDFLLIMVFICSRVATDLLGIGVFLKLNRLWRDLFKALPRGCGWERLVSISCSRPLFINRTLGFLNCVTVNSEVLKELVGLEASHYRDSPTVGPRLLAPL